MSTYRPTLKILSRVTANKIFFKDGPSYWESANLWEPTQLLVSFGSL